VLAQPPDSLNATPQVLLRRLGQPTKADDAGRAGIDYHLHVRQHTAPSHSSTVHADFCSSGAPRKHTTTHSVRRTQPPDCAKRFTGRLHAQVTYTSIAAASAMIDARTKIPPAYPYAQDGRRRRPAIPDQTAHRLTYDCEGNRGPSKDRMSTRYVHLRRLEPPTGRRFVDTYS